MRNQRGILMGMVVGALALSSCAMLVVLSLTRLPDPDTADLRGLMRWLVTRDLRGESDQTKSRLLIRLEQELAGGVQLGGLQHQLNPAQLQLLFRNADTLGQVWFLQQVDDYFAMPEFERADFLSQRIDEIQQSPLIRSLSTLTEIHDRAVAADHIAGRNHSGSNAIAAAEEALKASSFDSGGDTAAMRSVSSTTADGDRTAISPTLAAKPSTDVWSALAKRAEVWATCSEAAERLRAQQFLAAVKTNLFLQSLRNQFLPKR